MRERLIIGVYVDDMIITGPNSCKIKKFKENMKQVFKMTNLGILSSYLGIEIKHEESYTWLIQKSYIETILHTFNMSKGNSVRTPIEAWLKFEKDGREEEENNTLNSEASLVASGIWYMITYIYNLNSYPN